MKKVRRNGAIYLAMEIVFILCALLFLMIFLVCEPYDRIPVGAWMGGCVFMTVRMHLARKALRKSNGSSQDATPSSAPPDDSV